MQSTSEGRSTNMAKLELEIPDDMEARLQQDAEHAGLSIHTLAVRRLLAPYEQSEAASDVAGPRNLYEYVQNFVGIVGDGSGTKDYAERHSELFTEHLVEKQKAGHL
jgi:hypothetical protein